MRKDCVTVLRWGASTSLCPGQMKVRGTFRAILPPWSLAHAHLIATHMPSPDGTAVAVLQNISPCHTRAVHKSHQSSVALIKRCTSSHMCLMRVLNAPSQLTGTKSRLHQYTRIGHVIARGGLKKDRRDSTCQPRPLSKLLCRTST